MRYQINVEVDTSKLAMPTDMIQIIMDTLDDVPGKYDLRVIGVELVSDSVSESIPEKPISIEDGI